MDQGTGGGSRRRWWGRRRRRAIALPAAGPLSGLKGFPGQMIQELGGGGRIRRLKELLIGLLVSLLIGRLAGRSVDPLDSLLDSLTPVDWRRSPPRPPWEGVSDGTVGPAAIALGGTRIRSGR